MSSIPFAVNTTFAPALRSFSMRSFVMSASLEKEEMPANFLLQCKAFYDNITVLFLLTLEGNAAICFLINKEQ